MKSIQTLRSRLQTRLAARFIPNPLRSGRIAVFVTAAALLLALSAPAATVSWNWTAGDRNWSTPGNWSGGIPESTNAVIFGPTDAQVDTNTVNTMTASTTVSSLAYTNSSPTSYASFQNTVVASGQTLTITNGLNVGRGRSETGGGNVYTYASMTGAGGAVAVSGGNVAIADQGNTGAGSTDQLNALLDLRGLATFSYNNSAGTFRIAGNGQRRANGEVYFAGNNSITASAITLGYGGPAGIGSGPGKLHLGQTNALFADTITLGQRTTGSLIDFQTGLADPIVKIRARDGTSGVANWYLGWNSSPNQSASNGSGTNDFSGGILDASVTNLYVGYMSGGAPNGGRTAIGTFIVGTNVNNSLVVQNLFVGFNNAPSGGTGTGSTSTGNFVVGGGTVTATAVTLAQPGSYIANGTLTLSGGASMNVSGSITNGGGTSTSTISVSDATLNVGGVIGSPTANIGTLNLSNATLGLKLTAPGSYANAPASVGTLNIDGLAGSTVIKIKSTNASGQYPVIAYTSPGGSMGFDGLTVLPAPGTTATLSNNFSSFPYTVDVVISASAELVFTTAPLTQTAGDLSATITVRLQTGAGTPINTTSNLTVNLSTSSTAGVFRDLADTTTITSVVILTGSSSASFRYKDTKAPATPTLTATAPGYPPALQQETIVVGAAAQLGFTPQPANGFVGITLSPVVVQVQDPYGNPVTQSGTEVVLTLNGGTLDSGTTTQFTDGNGQAIFNDLLMMASATGLTFSASATGPLTGTSSSFDVTYRRIVKARNPNAMDLTTSWLGGVVPGQYDIAVFNDTSVGTSANSRTDFGWNASWYGIIATNWSAATGYTISNTMIGTLTLGLGGFIGTNVNHSMGWSNNFVLGTNQVWDWTGTGGTLTLNGDIDNGGYLFTLGGSQPITVNGSINGAGNIGKPGTNTLTVNGTVAAGGSLTITNGRLAGIGVINRAVTIDGAAQIAPGATALGTLTLNDNLTLNAGAEAVFRLNRTNAPATNDYLVVVGTQTINSGKITVTNRGPALVVGDSFALLSKPTAGFTTVNLPPGYTWNNKLAIDGTILVLAVTPPTPAPTNITYTINGSQLVMAWPAGQGWQLQAQTNTLDTGLGTNWSTISGATPPYTNAIDPANPSVFYRLTYP